MLQRYVQNIDNWYSIPKHSSLCARSNAEQQHRNAFNSRFSIRLDQRCYALLFRAIIETKKKQVLQRREALNISYEQM